MHRYFLVQISLCVLFLFCAQTQDYTYKCTRLVHEKSRCHIYNYNHPLCKKWDTSNCPPPKIIREVSQCPSYSCRRVASPVKQVEVAKKNFTDSKFQSYNKQQEEQAHENTFLTHLQEELTNLKESQRVKDQRIHDRLEKTETDLRTYQREKESFLEQLRILRFDLKVLQDINVADTEDIVRQAQLSKIQSRLDRQIAQLELDHQTHKGQYLKLDEDLRRLQGVVRQDSSKDELNSQITALQLQQTNHEEEYTHLREEIQRFNTRSDFLAHTNLVIYFPAYMLTPL